MYLITGEQKRIIEAVTGNLLDNGQEELALKLHGVTSKLTPQAQEELARPKERAWWNAQ